MTEVFHQPDEQETRIDIHADRVLRQTHSMFRQPVDSPGISSRFSSGVIHAPSKCGVKYGLGQFVFMGRIRLKRAHITCAPRLDEFNKVWKAAEQMNMLSCSLN